MAASAMETEDRTLQTERRAKEPIDLRSTDALPDEVRSYESLPESQDLQDRLQRLKAEFDNYRKRTNREWEARRQRMMAEVFTLVLPTLDDLERALKHSNIRSEEARSMYQGIALIYQNLRNRLQQQGMVPLEIEGLPFDPRVAEAVGFVDSDAEPGSVAQVISTGWRYGDTIIRPAKVLLAKKGEKKDTDGEHSSGNSQADFLIM